MTVTQHSTNAFGEFLPYVLKPAQTLAGITQAQDGPCVSESFLGFGVALTGASCHNLARMDKAQRTRLLRQLYTPEGLNLRVARLTVGSCDYSAELYTYDDVPGDTGLRHFSIDRDKEYIIPMIKEILEVAPGITLFASPWTPPGWMKTGGSIGGGYMREQYLDCYADYFVKFVQAYGAEGIPIHAVTVQNEPETQQSGKMTACIWHPDLEARFISILRHKFDENGITTQIWCHDHNFSGAGRVDWYLQEYPALRSDCAGIAFHYYSGTVENTLFLKDRYPELALHFTEGGPRLNDHYDCDWSKWGLMIAKALGCGYSSFSGWNLMLDQTGAPNVGPFPCGGLITRHSVTGELSYSGQYKALRHIAPFVKPNSRISPLTFSGQGIPMAYFAVGKTSVPSCLSGCVVEDPDGSKALLIVNGSDHREQIQYFSHGCWWYIELLPDTAATIVFQEH